MKICICGGGSLGHVCIGYLSEKNVDIFLLTKHPDKWESSIVVNDCQGNHFFGNINKISSYAKDVIPDSDIVLLCVPGFLIKDTLKEIKPYLTQKTIVGSVVSNTGFFFFAHDVLLKDTKLFGFQRVPFIARVVEYGHEANLLGYKSGLSVAIENIEDKQGFAYDLETLFDRPINILDNFYEATLSNSNPILHTGRLYSMWHDWNGKTWEKCILFYKEWDEQSAQIIIDMDREFMLLLNVLKIRKGAIPSLLEYYESYDAKSLADKISSIPAFQNILSPMKETSEGWIPDFNSRYFTEDFPYGLRFIKDLAVQYNIKTPMIDKVYAWGCKNMSPTYNLGII